MTAQEWLAYSDPQPMLEFLRGKASDRKLRLFACACCRSIWPLIPDSADRDFVTTTERFADGAADLQQVIEALDVATGWDGIDGPRDHGLSDAFHWTLECSQWAAHVAQSAARDGRWQGGEETAQTFILRHLFGNPFRPCPRPDGLPVIVIQLANALYNGRDCGFALHDALLDAGYADVAAHFRDEREHPKGCWALDLLLGKE